jgi:hypothetical protein
MRFFSTALGFVLVAQAFIPTAQAASSERQAEVAQRGAQVMPFELAETTHVFTKTRNGLIQRVVAKEGADAAQTGLVRAHLREIRQQFLQGDYSGPAHIHGADMPGLKALQAAKPGQIAIDYRDVPKGAELRFRTVDPRLAKALHEWADAQLSDHGADAHEGHHHHGM